MGLSRKRACKPSSVPLRTRVYARWAGFVPMHARAATIYLAPALPPGSSGQPGDWSGAVSLYLALHRMGFALTPGVTTGAVSSYLAISPLSRVIGTVCFCGTFRRVAPPRC